MYAGTPRRSIHPEFRFEDDRTWTVDETVSCFGRFWRTCRSARLVALLHGTASFPHALADAAIVPAIAVLAYWQLAGTRAFRCVGAALLMACSGLLIHLSGGMLELHFHVFVALALLIVYFDWLPISVAAVAIALHHVVMYFLAPDSVFPEGTTIGIVVIHAVFVVVEAAGLAYVAEQLRRGITAVSVAADQLASTRLPELVAAMQAVAEGDLTRTVNLKTVTLAGAGDDEMGRMVSSFDRVQQEVSVAADSLGVMISQLQAWLARSATCSSGVAETSHGLEAVGIEAGQEVEHAALAARHVAEGAKAQAASAEHTRQLVQQLLGAIEQVSSGASTQARTVARRRRRQPSWSRCRAGRHARQDVASATAQTRATAEQGAAAVRQTVTGMDDIKRSCPRPQVRSRSLGGWARASAPWSRRSTRSPSRPTCWR